MKSPNALFPALAVLTLVLAAVGCASAPSPPPAEPASPAASEVDTEEPSEAATTVGGEAALRFHVDGPGTGEGSCALRFYALHGSGLAPVTARLLIEIFRVSDGIFVSGMADAAPYELPSMTAVETIDGMESPLWRSDLNLPCDDLRAEVQVVSCDPSPCPSVGVQPGYNMVPLTVSGPDAG